MPENNQPTHETPYDGEPVYMAGKTWIVPGLSVRQLRKHLAVLVQAPATPRLVFPPDATPEALQQLMEEHAQQTVAVLQKNLDERFPIVLEAMQRNYPDLKEDDLLEMVDVKSLPKILSIISKESGLRPAKPGE
jgi:hypothetical protein